jgi:hypothetical protein
MMDRCRRCCLLFLLVLLPGCFEQPETRSFDLSVEGDAAVDREINPDRRDFDRADTHIVADASLEHRATLPDRSHSVGDGDGGTAVDARSVTVDDSSALAADNAVSPADSSLPGADHSAALDGGALVKSAFEGYGAHVTGGGDGPVYTVTTLGNAGPGSLREAVSSSKRTIRFAVAGTIRLSQSLRIVAHDLTIDGFSAPGPVTIMGMVEIVGNQEGPTEQGSNIILQGLRFRKGYDSLRIWRNAHDIVVDHNSFSGAGDGSCDITEGAFNITFSWNIVTKTGGEGKAMLFKYGAYHTSFHHNLFHRNEQRNPLIGSTTRSLSKGPPARSPLMDARYNVISHYGGLGAAVLGQGTSANFVANLFHTASTAGARPANHLRVKAGSLYAAGNVCAHDCRGKQYQTNFVVTTANSMSNSAELVAPQIAGPAISDRAGRIAEWRRVVAEAGPGGRSTVFAGQDDALESEARAGAKAAMPTADIFTRPWNDG